MQTKPNKGMKLTAMLLLLSLMLTACSLLPTSIGDTLEAGDGTVTISREEYERLQKYEELDEIRQMLETYFYQDLDEQTLLDYAALGMTAGTGDPFTFYYTPEEYAAMWEDDEGEYAGVGIQITANYETNICTISRVFLDTPAQKAGLRRGDILVKVDDLDVNATDLNDAVDLMRGQEGGVVTMHVLRNNEPMSFDVERAMIHVNWINSTMLDESIGYLAFYEFSGDCSVQFATHLNSLMEQGAKGLILDLRDNPGGWVDDALKIADMFLPEGLLTSMVYRDGSTENYRLTTDGKEVDIPVVILVNEYSASASELFSAAMQDYGRATIVGTQTYGKGIVQAVLPVGSRGAGIQITFAQYFTPLGKEVHGIGVTPDVVAELPEEQVGAYFELGDLTDPQLQTAYETAQGLVK